MKAAVASLQKLAADPQWVGGTLPILAVLHTWTRALLLHPHVHLLVPAGAIRPEGTWVDAHHPNFLVPGYALSQIFRAISAVGLPPVATAPQAMPRRLYLVPPPPARKPSTKPQSTRALAARIEFKQSF